GRCYETASGRTFVTYGDAERLPLYHGLEARLPLYTLSTERLLELAHSYACELGYTPTQEGTIVSEQMSIASGGLAHVEIPIGEEKPPVVITIGLGSTGDISLVASTETFLMP